MRTAVNPSGIAWFQICWLGVIWILQFNIVRPRGHRGCCKKWVGNGGRLVTERHLAALEYLYYAISKGSFFLEVIQWFLKSQRQTPGLGALSDPACCSRGQATAVHNNRGPIVATRHYLVKPEDVGTHAGDSGRTVLFGDHRSCGAASSRPYLFRSFRLRPFVWDSTLEMK